MWVQDYYFIWWVREVILSLERGKIVSKKIGSQDDVAEVDPHRWAKKWLTWECSNVKRTNEVDSFREEALVLENLVLLQKDLEKNAEARLPQPCQRMKQLVIAEFLEPMWWKSKPTGSTSVVIQLLQFCPSGVSWFCPARVIQSFYIGKAYEAIQTSEPFKASASDPGNLQ